jgi:hypothetical protein
MIGHGLGAASGNQIVSVVGGTTGSLLGGTVAIWAPLIGVTGPVGVAIAGLVAAGAAIAGALGVGEGCGPTCVQATNVVNGAEPIFRQNLAAYENGQIDQVTAQNNYNQGWAAIVQSCGGIPGGAGKNCVGDRQQGACTWKQTAPPQYPGQPQVGDCWNWYNAYYEPLTYPAVNAPTVSAASNVSSLMSNPMLLIGGGLVLVGLMVGGK